MFVAFSDPQNQEVRDYIFTLPKGRGTKLALSAKPDKCLRVNLQPIFTFMSLLYYFHELIYI